MNRRLAATAVAFALVSGVLVTGPMSEAALAGSTVDDIYSRVCTPAPPGFAACHEVIRNNPVAAQAQPGEAQPNVTAPAGYGPADLQAAYNLPSARGGVGRTIAIIDAYDLPTAESDLATYRSTFGLPPCTSANGCFVKVNQQGDPNAANLPPANAAWGREIALDLDMVSAACPNCGIMLVEADDANVANLAEAAATGATYSSAVTNSYGAAEFSDESDLDPYYNVPGVIYTASSGDTGYGTEYPAATSNVIAVGGTTLTKAGSSWTETTWYDDSGLTPQGTGSGCSAYLTKPVWQTDSGCARRTEVDVAAVADPNTGVATYDSTFGWAVAGGTSAAAPLIAGAYMLAGGPPVQHAPRLPYDRKGAHMRDITSGSNAASCSAPYLCTAGTGYDGPTGMGTPNGVADFRSIAGVSDFDSVGNSQFAVYRPSNHTWYVRGSSFYPQTWGLNGDIPVPADYIGDSFTGAAVYRPSNHRWYVQFQTGTPPAFGSSGDVPVPADYNGDGRADIAMWRPSSGTWYIRGIGSQQWGQNGDVPVVGDYNGDGTSDFAIWRPSQGKWYVRGIATVSWGVKGDVPVPGDYNGDGKTDFAVYRPSNHTWYIRGIETLSYGSVGDAPEPGDYTGDGKTDIAVWRISNGNWYVRGLPASTQWGLRGDSVLSLPYAIDRAR